MNDLWEEAVELAEEQGLDANDVYQDLIDREEYRAEMAYDAWREENES